MAELETQPEPKQKTIGAGQAYLLVAVPAPLGSEVLSSTIEKLSQAASRLSLSCPLLLAVPGEEALEEPVEMEAASHTNLPLRYVTYTQPATDAAATPWLANTATQRSIFSLANKIGIRSCTVLGTDVGFNRDLLTPEKLSLFMGPGVEGNFDLVMPLYSMQAFDDLLNKSILYPLTRALYGHRVRYPLANELQASSKLMQKFPANFEKDSVRQQGRLLWLATTAVNQNLKICQVQLGARRPQGHEGIELSDALAQLAGPLFTDMEDNAAFWQRVRGSHDVPTFGNAEVASGATDTVDVRRMIEAFELGVRNLREIWSLVLPPVTLMEVKKLSRLTPDTFHMSDALWARIIYDFALAHRLRNIHRAHLFGALTPLYLGWVASYAVEVNAAGIAMAEERVEQLARAYEAEKPYLLSRWRWPDRFHP